MARDAVLSIAKLSAPFPLFPRLKRGVRVIFELISLKVDPRYLNYYQGGANKGSVER